MITARWQMATPGSIAGFVVFAALVAVLSVLFGLVAVSANPIIVGVAGGLLVGCTLIARPVWNLWLVLTLGLLVAGLVPLWADALASRAVWGISVLCFLLLFVSFLRLVTFPGAVRALPGFVWILIAFLVYAVGNSLLQWHSPYETFGGIKRYFQAFGVTLAFACLSIKERDVRAWQVLLVVVAVLQLPWALYERIVLLPIRESIRLAFPGMVPIDVVSGTFGASIHEGGGNSEMATFLIIVFAFLVSRWREGLLSFQKLALASPIVLAPLFLGETKVVVILLPLAFLGLYWSELLARPLRALAAFCVVAVLTGAAVAAYLQINRMTLSDQVTETLSYNVFERGHGLYKLNRTKVLSFWAQQQSASNPVSAVFGNGLGAAHDKTLGHVSARYFGYGIGLTAASTLLWEQGIFGLGLYLLALFLAWRTARQLRRDARLPWVRADAAAIEAAIPLFVVYVFYRLTMLEHLPFQLVVATILGYLAWLGRMNASGGQSAA